VVVVQLPTNLRRMNNTLFGVPGAVYDADFGTLTYSPIAVLAAGDTVRSTFTFKMPASGFAQGVASSTAQASGPGGASDPIVANNDGSQPAAQITTSGPLPVELTRFVAKGRGVDAQLTWATASERDAAYFAVERSLDGGATYSEVGRRTAAGTTSTPREYALTDNGIGRTSRTVYYRLRQVDFDGTTDYSAVQVVTFAGRAFTHVVAVFPNPVSAASATTTVDTELEGGSYDVTLFDATGRRVLTATQVGGTTQPLNVEALPVGTYLVRVTGPAGFSTTKRLLKQ
jgi:hypothetical protein